MFLICSMMMNFSSLFKFMSFSVKMFDTVARDVIIENLGDTLGAVGSAASSVL